MLLAVPYSAQLSPDPTLAKATNVDNKVEPLSSLATPAPETVTTGSRITSWTTPSPAYQFQNGSLVDGAQTIDIAGTYLITATAKVTPAFANTEVALNLVAENDGMSTVLAFDSATLGVNGGGLKIFSVNSFPAGSQISLQIASIASASVQGGATLSITRLP